MADNMESATPRLSDEPLKALQSAAVSPNWSAVGDPLRDLSPWVHQWTSPTHQHRNGHHAVVVSRAAAADELEGERLTELSRDLFDAVLAELPGGPCRVWAFLPRPTDRDRDFLERYMRFNAGRTAAYRAHDARVHTIPAGTCVGHAGPMLVVHALWTPEEFQAIENPRQRPAYLYSSRFGPVPPAFTRGARVGRTLLASGTASVVGEDSAHDGNVEEQFYESCRNLDALAHAAGGTDLWRDVCIYVKHREDMPVVARLAQKKFGAEFTRLVHAAICRRELLVEIEGICNVH